MITRLFYCNRSACGFESSDKFIITGGWISSGHESAVKTVISYSRTGDAEGLPELNVARWEHACGSYETDEGDNVRFILNFNK